MNKYELIDELMRRRELAREKRNNHDKRGEKRAADYEDGKVTAYSMAAELAMRLP